MDITKITAGLLSLFLVAGCSVQATTNAGCSTYASQSLQMPDPADLGGSWLRWVNETDAAMWAACK